MTKQSVLTLDNLEETLANDTKIKVAAVDIDGLLRGKVMHKDKFLHVAKDGFGKFLATRRERGSDSDAPYNAQDSALLSLVGTFKITTTLRQANLQAKIASILI